MYVLLQYMQGTFEAFEILRLLNKIHSYWRVYRYQHTVINSCVSTWFKGSPLWSVLGLSRVSISQESGGRTWCWAVWFVRAINPASPGVSDLPEGQSCSVLSELLLLQGWEMKCPSVLHNCHVQVHTCGKHWISCVCVWVYIVEPLLMHKMRSCLGRQKCIKGLLELGIFRKNCCNVGSGHDTTIGSLIYSSWRKDLWWSPLAWFWVAS